MSGSNKGHSKLEQAYRRRYAEALVRIAGQLAEHLATHLNGQRRIDRVVARAKGVDKFLQKAVKLTDEKRPKYLEPLSQIQDQIGARIVVFYKSDVDPVEKIVLKYFRAIEMRTLVPESESEFGYAGRHLVLALPADVVPDDVDSSLVPDFFELQIKTLFQHAWSEADHDLGYKPGETGLTGDQKRLVAFTAAQAWGADHIFDQLFLERIRESGT